MLYTQAICSILYYVYSLVYDIICRSSKVSRKCGGFFDSFPTSVHELSVHFGLLRVSHFELSHGVKEAKKSPSLAYFDIF